MIFLSLTNLLQASATVTEFSDYSNYRRQVIDNLAHIRREYISGRVNCKPAVNRQPGYRWGGTRRALQRKQKINGKKTKKKKKNERPNRKERKTKQKYE